MDKIRLSLILDYFSRRRQRTKLDSSYSLWYDTVRGVSQGSIIGLLLFNLFLTDLFFVKSRGLKYVTLPMTTHYTAQIKSYTQCLKFSKSQPAFTCSKLTKEALEQGMKYVQS